MHPGSRINRTQQAVETDSVIRAGDGAPSGAGQRCRWPKDDLLQQMLRPDRMIRRHEVRFVIEQGEIIEDYPTDARGHSCLMLGQPSDRPIHVVCAPKDEYLAVLAAYLPDEEEWSADFRTRIER